MEELREKIARLTHEQETMQKFSDEGWARFKKRCPRAYEYRLEYADQILSLFKGWVQLADDQTPPELRGCYRLDDDCNAMPITELEATLQLKLAQVTQQDMLTQGWKKVRVE